MIQIHLIWRPCAVCFNSMRPPAKIVEGESISSFTTQELNPGREAWGKEGSDSLPWGSRTISGTYQSFWWEDKNHQAPNFSQRMNFLLQGTDIPFWKGEMSMYGLGEPGSHCALLMSRRILYTFCWKGTIILTVLQASECLIIPPTCGRLPQGGEQKPPASWNSIRSEAQTDSCQHLSTLNFPSSQCILEGLWDSLCFLFD